jgi:sulfur carrier protein
VKLKVNGEVREVPDGLTVQQVLDRLGFTQRSFAVARNLEFVPRGDYAATVLKDNDELEIVTPRQGG